MKLAGFRPVGCEDVERWGLLAGVVRLLQWDRQRRAIKQLLVLNSRTPEGLPHGDVLKRHLGKEGQMEKREERGRKQVLCEASATCMFATSMKVEGETAF